MLYFFSLWASKFYWAYRKWLRAKRWHGYAVQAGMIGLGAGLWFSSDYLEDAPIGVYVLIALLSVPYALLEYATYRIWREQRHELHEEMVRINKMHKYVPPKQE